MIKTLLVLAVAAHSLPIGLAQCNMCASFGGNITVPDKPISLPRLEFVQTCGQLQELLPFLPDASPECSLLKSIGTLCGCERSPDACDFCPDGSPVISNPGLEMPFLTDLFGVVPTCELALEYLNSFHKDDDFCLLSHALLAGYCGCPSSPYDADAPPCTTCRTTNGGGDSILLPNRNQSLSIPGFPFETCGQLDDAVGYVIKAGTEECELVHKVSSSLCGCPALENPCTLCKDGSNITIPDKEAHFARNILFGIVPTCSIVEAYTSGHEVGSDFCNLAQQAGSFCGCPSKFENHCIYCPDEGGFPEDTKRIDPSIITLDEDLKIEPTCELIEATQFQWHAKSGTCVLGKLSAFLCGCNGGAFNYAGADSDAKKDTLTWLSRAASILALVGSLSIQVDVLKNKRRRRHVYNRIVLVMSFFDACTALGLLIGPAAMPEENWLGTPLAYPGSDGNRATCKIQGFIIELGITSIYYTISLSVYYYLTIVSGWREDGLKKSQKWFHGVPIAFGVVSASVGIPFYDITPFGCYLYPIPVTETLPWMIPLAYAPVIFTVIFLIVTMIYIYWKVLAQDNKANKWRMGKFDIEQMRESRSQAKNSTTNRTKKWLKESLNLRKSKNSKLVAQVYWQGVSYVSGFLISWPIMVVGFLNADAWAVSNYPFWVAFSICIPMQGLINAYTYFRPRWVHRYCIWKKQRTKNAQMEANKVHVPSQFTQETGTSTVGFSVTKPSSAPPTTASRLKRFSLKPQRRGSNGSDYSEGQALVNLRNQDPSAYLAVAGLSSCSTNSQRSNPVDNNNLNFNDTDIKVGEGSISEGLEESRKVSVKGEHDTNPHASIISSISLNDSLFILPMDETDIMINDSDQNDMSKLGPAPPPSISAVDNVPFVTIEGQAAALQVEADSHEQHTSLQREQQPRSRKVSFMEHVRIGTTKEQMDEGNGIQNGDGLIM